jgi:hypothetical protein
VNVLQGVRVSLNGAQRGYRKGQAKRTCAGKNEDARGNARRERSETLEQDKSFRIEIDREREERRKKDFLLEVGKEIRIGELFIE